jgi:hypothetical protein
MRNASFFEKEVLIKGMTAFYGPSRMKTWVSLIAYGFNLSE